MEAHPLLQSLLPTRHNASTTRTLALRDPNIITNVSNIIFRIILISIIGIIAIWANHEAAKGFSIIIVNDACKLSSPGKRFSLLYESNDKATRIVLNTSTFVENILYPNRGLQHNTKQINSVTLRLAPTNFPAMVTVDSRKPGEYLISLSPSVMETLNNNEAIESAVLQGMARVWLWDSYGATPVMLLNGMVEYISGLAGFRQTEVWWSGGGATVLPENNDICWKDEDPRRVAGFLRYCDGRKQQGGGGEVIRRLNEGMRDGWQDRTVDDVLGMACASDNMVMWHQRPSNSM